MKTTVKEITPQYARQVLDSRNRRNRPISELFVDRLARDITNGAWLLTHQGIAFDTDNILLDGQHRLAAVVKANMPVSMLVTTGVPNTARLNGTSFNTFEVIDGGRKRGVGQMLQMAGFINANKTAAATRTIINMCAGTEKFISLSTAQTHKAIHALGGSVEKMIAIVTAGKIVRPSCGVAAACALLHTSQPEQAESFISEVCDVTGVKGSPSRALCTWISNHPQGSGNPGIYAARATATCLWHVDRGTSPGKVFSSTSAMDWLLALNPKLTQKLAEIVRL